MGHVWVKYGFYSSMVALMLAEAGLNHTQCYFSPFVYQVCILFLGHSIDASDILGTGTGVTSQSFPYVRCLHPFTSPYQPQPPVNVHYSHIYGMHDVSCGGVQST